MKKIFLVLIFLTVFTIWPKFALAEQFYDRDKITISFEKLDWQTYVFEANANFDQSKIIRYHWQAGSQKYNGQDLEQIKKVFDSGRYMVLLEVYDEYGNKLSDFLHLDIVFWSFYNTRLLMLFLGFLFLAILYYWLMKLMYFLNQKRISKKTKQFFSFLDEHGWFDQVIKEILKKYQNKDKEK